MQPPAQELVARDLHDNVWTFRHIYRGIVLDSSQSKQNFQIRCFSLFVFVFNMSICVFLCLGQPKRHLLTTGWSLFVSGKRLFAGDSVLFIRFDEELRLLGLLLCFILF